jgi:hypothetical protein
LHRRVLRLLFGLTVIATAAYVYISSGALPDPLASHFRFDGHADSRMPREAYQAVMTGITLLIPLFVVVMQIGVPRIFTRFINIPRRDYWLATPERRKRMLNYLESHALITGLVPPLFLAAIQGLVVDANTRLPPQLNNQWFYLLGGAFVICLIFSGVSLVLHFRRAE